MRDGFARLAKEYPVAPAVHDIGFAGSPLRSLVGEEIPKAIRTAVPDVTENYRILGSIGKGSWTHTPWVALLDPAVTATTEEGLYVIYLLSFGADRLYLTVNQGCTTLKSEVGLQGAKEVLSQRARTIWSRIKHGSSRLQPLAMDLNVDRTVWRGKLYEHGLVVGRAYDARQLPHQSEMLADLREALELCRLAEREGEWEDEDIIIRQASDAGIMGTFAEAKRYRQHRSIERQAVHSNRVKKVQGTRCRGCDLDMVDVYGAVGANMVDAHHLLPLSSLREGVIVSLDPFRDFAVLCPNCHRAIHRLPDCSDVGSLRALVSKGMLRPKAEGLR